MDIVKTTLALQFSEAFRPWLDLRSVIRLLSENQTAEIQGQPVVVTRGKKQERITFQARGISLEQEAVKSVGSDYATSLVLLNQIDNVFGLPAISQVRHDVIAIEPFPVPFYELVTLLKRLYIQPSPIFASADDIGLSFDEHQGDTVKHVQIGPMIPEQLRSTYLAFSNDKLPDQFVFISLGYEDNHYAEYDAGRVRQCLEAAATWQRQQLQTISSEVHESGGI